MPTGPRREDPFIEAFLSAYENLSWADADRDWVDRRSDNAVEMVATRKSDGKQLAIEHTLIEPFVSEKEDYHAFFKPSFLKIEEDKTLIVPGRAINVYVPAGTLRGHRKPAAQDAIVNAVHDWIRANRLGLPDGPGQTRHQCKVAGALGPPTFEITLTVETVPLSKGPGMLCVRRQQVSNDLDDVVRKALTNKLPKLARQSAGRRVLILERQHMNFLPAQILNEIEKQRAEFPSLSVVDEIWILETIDYEQTGYFRFELKRGGSLVAAYDFQSGALTCRFENGRTIPT